MSMSEPLQPHPSSPDTAFDERQDAPVPEQHGEPAEANETLSSAGVHANEVNDPLPLPDDAAGGHLTGTADVVAHARVRVGAAGTTTSKADILAARDADRR